MAEGGFNSHFLMVIAQRLQRKRVFVLFGVECVLVIGIKEAKCILIWMRDGTRPDNANVCRIDAKQTNTKNQIVRGSPWLVVGRSRTNFFF